MNEPADDSRRVRAERAAGRFVLCRALNVGLLGLHVDDDGSVADVVSMPIRRADTARLVLAAAAAGNVICGRDKNFAQVAARADMQAFRGDLANFGLIFDNAIKAARMVLEPYAGAVGRIAYWLAVRRLPPGFIGITEAVLSPMTFTLEDVPSRDLADEHLDIEMLQVVRLREDPATPGWQMPGLDLRLISLLAEYLGRDAPLPLEFCWADEARPAAV